MFRSAALSRSWLMGMIVLASAVLARAPAGAGAAGAAGTGPAQGVPYIAPKGDWDRFLILVWQYLTDVRKDLPLYRQVNLFGFHIDRGAGQEGLVAFARQNALPYYVDHAADKGYLHLTPRTGSDKVVRRRDIVARPVCLVDPKTIDLLKDHLRRNITATRTGPVVAYAFDDEVSTGVFNSPAEVDGSPLSVADYRRWLKETYGGIDKLNAVWGAKLAGFDEVQPVPFEAVRARHAAAPFANWNLAPWMDWRSYMDSQFAACVAELTRYANSLDGNTPAGFVGGQQPAPYGGYDYAKLARSIQWIESYDIGGSCEILRSLWGVGPQRRPYVQTWFSTGEARRDAWFLWYYLLHGNRGVIAWPDRNGSWFRQKDGKIADFITQNAAAIAEVQGEVSKAILGLDVRFEADPIAVYYSHPSVQATWAMDVVPHGTTWPNRSSSLDNGCQSAGKNREAWFKLLEDCGFQYNVITPEQVAGDELIRKGYRVLIACRLAAMSDGEAQAIRRFVQQGGTVIADHLTGVLTEHGVGRPGGGALNDLFGIARDEAKGYLGGKGITEINGERYDKPFLQRLMYEGALRHEGIVVYERGTKAKAGKAAATVDSADVVIRNRLDKGLAVYLNLTPMAYYEMDERLGDYGQTWRKLLTGLLAESGLHPRAQVLTDGKPIPLAELVYWRRGQRVVVGLVKNPTREGTISSAGAIHGVTGQPVEVEIIFRQPVANVVNLRTGQKLKLPDGAGKAIRPGTWNPWEAILLEVTPEPAGR